MPEISRFLGIVIRMYHRDHSPPHFHAEYGEYEVTLTIRDSVVEGKFPRRAFAAVLERYHMQSDALRDNWQRAERREPMKEIPPLE